MKQKYLLLLFILTLSVSIFLGSVSSSYSQNPTSNPSRAKTLSYTNLPQAVDILAEYYHQPHLLEVRQELIRMGDLAVSTLESIAMENCVEAMDDLVAIGTPDAADTLAKFLHNPQLKEEAVYRAYAVFDKLKEDENSSDRL